MSIASPTSAQSYLHFLIEQSIKAVVPMDNVVEVASIPVERITAVPNMPIYVLGLLHQRSRVIWLIDLPEFLGLAPINLDTQEYNIAIVETKQKTVGLVVLQIQEVARYSINSLESIENKGKIAQLEPYLKGNIRKSEEEAFPLLNVEIIFDKLIQ